MKKIIFISLISLIFLSCNKSVKVENFNPFSNWEQKNDTIQTIYLDYTDAIDSGFVIPSKNQVKEGTFVVSFDIDNGTDTAKEFYYKIYYQNESYKFPEVNDQDTLVSENLLASENFYGSWENTSKTFVSTGTIESGKKITIKDEIRIVGNPRNEQRYYGANDYIPTEEEINTIFSNIKNIPEWYAQIVQKSKTNKISVEAQMRIDAIYVLTTQNPQKGINQRWKRNLRVGNYKFMLVVVEKEIIEKNIIPEYIKDISKTDGNRFVNPFYFFLHGEGKKMKGIYLNESNTIKVLAKPDLGSGIFIDSKKLNGKKISTTYYSGKCGESDDIYKKAHFQQFFHNIRSTDNFKNIPVIKDIFKEKYTIEDFENNRQKYTPDKQIDVSVAVTDCPCQTVESDTKNNKIIIRNPGTKENEWRKESVGVKTRHGFTYGKFRAKVKLTRLLNEDGVWNGITNAIWLIFENGSWNNRRQTAPDKGYLPKEQVGRDVPRVRDNDYSEIDFEIVKTSRDWPNSSYSPKRNFVPFNNDKKFDVAVACTNWDLATQEPPKFDVGVHAINYKGEDFLVQRWDHWYKALTSKVPANEKELFGSEYYYFEIDWHPTEIIWRIGPSIDKMKIVGYMNDEYTSIPNNQMLMVFTQEFHLGNWWPMTPFPQDYIPFPKNDYYGEIYEIVIE